MYQIVTFSTFCDSFSDSCKDNFSYEGKRALFDYLEELEEGTGEKIELDTVALCCEYTEYPSIESVREAYENIKDLEDLQDHTTVIEIENNNGTKSDRIIIQDF